MHKPVEQKQDIDNHDQYLPEVRNWKCEVTHE